MGGGPRRRVSGLDAIGWLALAAKGGAGSVVTGDAAGMFAAAPGDVLTAPDGARSAATHYTDWLATHYTDWLAGR